MMDAPQIEIIHCLQEEDMADEKDKKAKRERGEDTTPVERCPVPEPKPDAAPLSGGGGTGSNPPTPPK